MQSLKPVNCLLRMASCAALLLSASTALAGRYWVAADGSDAKWSNTANWATTKDGASGASEPNAAEATGTIYFCKYKNGATVFDKLGEGPGNVLFGTQDSRYFVWSATDPTYGLDATGKEFHLCENIGNGDRTPANLQVDSGAYKFGRVYFPNLANGESELLVKGGTIKTTETSDTGVFRLCATQAGTTGTTTGTLTIDGGIFDCSSGGYMRVGGLSNVVATIHVKSGELKTRGMILGGSAGHKEICQVDNSISRMILDGGALTISHEGAIGCSVGDGTSSEMIVNAGATVNCNYGYFYVAEAGPGTLTMNGGTFTMQDSSDGGLSFGRVKNGNDVGTLVLNGGVLTTSKIRLKYVQSGSRIVFNGGTLKPTSSTPDFLNESSNLTCEVQEGGLVFDTAGFDVTIAHPIVAAEGAAKTPLVKKGAGTLKLDGTTPFDASDITVYAGSVVIGGVTNGVNAEAAIDASAGGDLGEVVIHREKLEDWLKDADFRNVAKYGANGTAMMEQPEPVIIDVNGSRKTYINLETGKTYNDTIDNVSFSFTTEDLAPRTLQIIAPDNDPVENVRDVGSWPLLGGRKMNQGVILRGGHLDHFVGSSPEQKAASFLTTGIGLKSEIELRKADVDLPDAYKNSANEITNFYSNAASDCAYVYCGLGWGDDAGTQIRADDNGNFTNQIRKVFATWGTEGKLPSYFHCRIGTDRTGIVGLLLLGMMGVEEEVLYRDYLMSNFAIIGGSRDTNVPDTFIRYLLRGNCNDGKYVYDTKDAQYGVSIASRARQYLEMCGVTEAQLDVITTALSGEAADEVLARVNAYEQANNVRTVSYVPYSGSTDVKGMHRLPAGEHITPLDTPTRNGYVFNGWDTEHESNGIVYALWTVDSSPKTRYWADSNGASERFNRVESWDPAPGSMSEVAQDTLVLNKGAEKIATFEAGDDVTVKNLSLGEGEGNLGGKLDMSGGTLTVTDKFRMGVDGSAQAVNTFNISGGSFIVNQLRISENADSVDRMVVSGEDTVVNSSYAVYIGTKGSGELTINGGLMSVAYAVQLGDGNASGNTAVLNLNGGTVKVPQVNLHGSTTGVFNWNGGILERGNNTFIANGEMCPANPNLTVRVLEGGAFYKGSDTYSFSQPISGVGAFTKLGSGTLTLGGAVNLKGGFKVEAGTLNVSHIVRTYFKTIEVADGASLNLNGAEVTVERYVSGTKEYDLGTYDECNGTINVVASATDGDPATAVWVNTIGDGDFFKPDNWVVRNEDGGVLDGVMPDSNTEVFIYNGVARPDFTGFPVKSVVFVVPETTYMRGDCSVPAVAKEAKCWFDFDDESTVAMQSGTSDDISSITNKGTAAEMIPNATICGPGDKRLPRYGVDKVNGRNILSLSGLDGVDNDDSKGLRTGVIGLEGNADRTIVVASRRGSTSAHFPLGIETSTGDHTSYGLGHFRIQLDGSGKFKYCDMGYSNPDRSLDVGQYPAGWMVGVFQATRNDDGESSTLTSRIYSIESGLKTASAQATNLNTQASACLYMGVTYGGPWNYSAGRGQIAEALYFDRALTEDEQIALQNYLVAKWVSPSDDMANMPENIVLENGAKLDLGGGCWTFDTIKGAGTIGTANVTVTGSLEAGLTVGGTVTFAQGATIDLSPFDTAEIGTHVVVLTADKIENWPTKIRSKSRACALRLVENANGTVSLEGDLSSAGFAIKIR